MLAALLLQARAVQPLPRDVWASLSSSVSLAHSSETVEFLRPESSVLKDAFTLRLTSRHLGKAPKIMWADSRTCPVVAEAINGLRSIPMPTPVFPGDPEDIVLDGVGYQVRFYGRYGSEIGFPVELRSNTGTPLAPWVSNIFRKLKPCWSENRPI